MAPPSSSAPPPSGEDRLIRRIRDEINSIVKPQFDAVRKEMSEGFSAMKASFEEILKRLPPSP